MRCVRLLHRMDMDETMGADQHSIIHTSWRASTLQEHGGIPNLTLWLMSLECSTADELAPRWPSSLATHADNGSVLSVSVGGILPCRYSIHYDVLVALNH